MVMDSRWHQDKPGTYTKTIVINLGYKSIFDGNDEQHIEEEGVLAVKRKQTVTRHTLRILARGVHQPQIFVSFQQTFQGEDKLH